MQNMNKNNRYVSGIMQKLVYSIRIVYSKENPLPESSRFPRMEGKDRMCFQDEVLLKPLPMLPNTQA